MTATVSVVTYKYAVDAENRIVRKTGGSNPYQLLHAQGPYPVAKLDSLGAVVATFHYATGRNVPDAMVTSSGTYKLVTDHLGSVRLVVNASSGAIVQRYDYDAWGNATLVTGTASFQPFGFAGGIYDADTKLVRFGARDYNPRIARWMTKDLARFEGGSNFYEYANDDPVNLLDHDGYQVAEEGAEAAEEIGGFLASTAIGEWLLDHLHDLLHGPPALIPYPASPAGGVDIPSDAPPMCPSIDTASKMKGCSCQCASTGVLGEAPDVPPEKRIGGKKRYPDAASCTKACVSVGFSIGICK